MDQLTNTEKRYLNDVTRRYPLGDLLKDIITHARRSSAGAAPVNAVPATKTLTISGVVIDGETVTVNNPSVTGSDVYEFCADEAQTVTAVGNIPVDITASVANASGTLTLAVQPTSGDTMTVGTKTFTFVPVGTANADGEVSIGADLAAAKLALVAAVNGTDDHNEPHPSVSISDFTVNAATVTALVGGTGGNSIATTETFTSASNVFAAATLSGGTNCSAANAVTALVAAITSSDTQLVSGADGAGDTVVITADVAGVSGNAIVIGETMANGAFASGATALSGGVDGTVGVAHETRSDDTYLYVCTEDNTVADANWRRISLGNVY